MSKRKSATQSLSTTQIEFSEEDAASLRQAAAFDKEFPPTWVDEDTGEVSVIPEFEAIMRLAMRHSLTLSGAPARCRRKSCASGRCHFRIEADGEGVCHGGITQAAVDDAAKMLGFLTEVSKHYCPWAFK